MDPTTYQQSACRTECNQEAASRRRYFFDREQGLVATRLSHAALGLTGEVGELAYAVEKWLQYGQPLDRNNVKEEIGDCCWYLALACNALGLDFGEVLDANIAKLRARYPEKYTDEQAVEEHRDRNVEALALTAQDHHAYNRLCSAGCGNRIHKTNTCGLCPDCYTSRKALAGGTH